MNKFQVGDIVCYRSGLPGEFEIIDVIQLLITKAYFYRLLAFGIQIIESETNLELVAVDPLTPEAWFEKCLK